MPIHRRCLITEFFNSTGTAFVATFQRTSALSFTEPSPSPSPSCSVDLYSIFALVQVFYCFLCTSRNSLSLADHNCAPVKVSFQRTSRELVDLSDVPWRRYFQRNLYLSKRRLFTDWHRYRISSDILIYQRRTDLVYWKRLEARSTVRVPSKETLESSESFGRTIAELQKLNKPECFQLWLTRQRTFLTKKTFSCPPLCRLFKDGILERSFLVSAILEKKQLVTQ